MKKIKFGTTKIEGLDFVVTKVEDFGNLLVISCADAHQMLRIDIPKDILASSMKNTKIEPKFRDRITLYRVSLNDAGLDDDYENLHFYASFLLAADINGRRWFVLPENKAFSLPFNTGII